MKGDRVYKTDAGFNVPTDHFPTYEELQRLSQGDGTVVNELIEALTNYVLRETDWLAHSIPSARPFKEDLASVALLTLTEEVNDLLGRKQTPVQLVAYIKEAVRKQQLHWLNDYGNGPVRIPKRSRMRGEQPLCVELDDSLVYNDSGQADIIFDDFLSSLPPAEQEIIRMKLHGCTNQEIGEELRIDPRRVNSMLRGLLAQFWDEV